MDENTILPQELLLYVKQEVDFGTSLADLKTMLLTKGWSEEEIDRAIRAAQQKRAGSSSLSLFKDKIIREFKSLCVETEALYKSKQRVLIPLQGIILITLIIVTFLERIVMVAYGYTIISFLSGLINLLLYASILYAIVDRDITSVGVYIRTAIKNFFRFWIVSVVPLFIIVAPVFLTAFFGTLILKILSTFLPGIEVLIPVVIGLALLFGIFLGAWFLLAPFVFVVEKTGIIESFRLSRHYSQNHVPEIIAHIIILIILEVALSRVPKIGSFLVEVVAVPIGSIYLYRFFLMIKDQYVEFQKKDTLH